MGAMSLWAVLVLVIGSLGQGDSVTQRRGDADVNERTSHMTEESALADVRLQIVLDNYACSDQLETAWGFSATC